MKMNDTTFVDVPVTYNLGMDGTRIDIERVQVEKSLFITRKETLNDDISKTVNALKGKVIVDIKVHHLAELFKEPPADFDMTEMRLSAIEKSYARVLFPKPKNKREVYSKYFIKGTDIEIPRNRIMDLNLLFLENIIVFEIDYRKRLRNELV